MTMPMHSDKEGRYLCGENYLGMPVTAYVSYDEYDGGFTTHWSTLPEHRNPVRLFSEHDVKAFRDEAISIIKDFVQTEVEYMTVNLLGDPEKQHNVKWARAFFKKYSIDTSAV